MLIMKYQEQLLSYFRTFHRITVHADDKKEFPKSQKVKIESQYRFYRWQRDKNHCV